MEETKLEVIEEPTTSTESTPETVVIKKPVRGRNKKTTTPVGRVKKGRPAKDKLNINNLDWSKMLVSEIFQMISSARTKPEKIQLLQKLKCPALIKILVINYNPHIISMLPEGDVPYTKNKAPAGTTHTSLHNKCKLLHHFFKGGNDTLPQLKRENMFIELLESLHVDDANLLVHTKDKRLQELYRISETLIKEAYPEFLQNVN